MEDPRLRLEIAALLAAPGLGAGGFRIEPCAAGGNNRVYRVDVRGRAFLAKRYFRHPTDDRDRLNAEYCFLEYAQKAGIHCVPKPVARNDSTGIALYEFIEGRKLAQDELCAEHIDQARDFFLELNHPGKRLLAANISNASEARFSISDQLELVQQRVDRLSSISAGSEVDAEAIAFTSKMHQQWAALRARVLAESRVQGIDPLAPIALEDRCISPSDFGFHNALATPGGRVIFLDFEYAGWDDPAKMVSDFFSQPAVPVPIEHFDRFLASALAFSPNAEMLAVRTRILLPVFRMKWCCIVMNEFLPSTLRRRKFADPSSDEAGRKRVQLDKAQRLFPLIQFQKWEDQDGLH
jgi:phosphotransferase family enzyme